MKAPTLNERYDKINIYANLSEADRQIIVKSVYVNDYEDSMYKAYKCKCELNYIAHSLNNNITIVGVNRESGKALIKKYQR